RNLSDRPQGSELSRRARGLRRQPSRRSEAHRELLLPRDASFHLRWPLRLRLAGNWRVFRPHPRDPRLLAFPAPPAPPPLVDAGAVVGRRGKADVGGNGASLPSSHPPRRSALRQLLAWRVRDSRHRGSEQAEIRFRPRLVAAVSLADPYRAPGAVCAA